MKPSMYSLRNCTTSFFEKSPKISFTKPSTVFLSSSLNAFEISLKFSKAFSRGSSKNFSKNSSRKAYMGFLSNSFICFFRISYDYSFRKSSMDCFSNKINDSLNKSKVQNSSTNLFKFFMRFLPKLVQGFFRESFYSFLPKFLHELLQNIIQGPQHLLMLHSEIPPECLPRIYKRSRASLRYFFKNFSKIF